MNLAGDFEEMLATLSSEGVEFLVVGGYAVMAHTEPRYTKDLDVWIRPTVSNARRMLRALQRFGAPDFGLSAAQLTRPDLVVVIGVEPVRIDVLTSIDGVRFEEAWKRRATVRFRKTSVGVLSAADLIRNKRRVGRPQDLLDVAKLKAAAAPVKARGPRRKR